MLCDTVTNIEKKTVDAEGAYDVGIQWLIGPDSQAPHFYMRLFEVAPGGHTPFHSHQMEHEIYVIDGRGKINHETGFIHIGPGSFALVQPNEKHQFENCGDQPLHFLCIIPKGY